MNCNTSKVNRNTSELVYLGIRAYQRNLGSHVTLRMSAPPVRKTAPKFDWQFYERNPESQYKTNLKSLHMKRCCPQTENSRTSRGYKIIQITCHAEETSLDNYDETSCCHAIDPCDVFIKLVKSSLQPNKRLFFHLSVF